MNALINDPVGKRFLLVFMIASLIGASCAKTRTIDPLTQSEQSKIKKIAIFVREDEGFDFDVKREKYQSHSSDIFSAIGDILALIGQYIEQEIFEANLEAKLPKPSSIMADKLKQNIELSTVSVKAEIPSVKSRSILKAEGFDTILEVNLKDWGLDVSWKRHWWDFDPEEKEVLTQWSKYSHKQGSAKQFLYSEDVFHLKEEELVEMERTKKLLKEIDYTNIDVWIESSARMSLIDNDTTMWEGVVNYQDENSYSPADFTRQPTLFVDILTRAIHTLAENTVNEIL